MRRFKVLAIGDIVIDNYPDSNKRYIGGSATNVALTITRNSLEYNVDLVGIIGLDKPGRQIYSRLKTTDINLDKIIKMPGKTAQAAWKRKNSGTELIKVEKGVDQGIPLDYLMSIEIEDYDLVHATPYSLGLNEINYLKTKSKRFSFDASFIFRKSDIIELLPATNWVFVSGDLANNYQWLEGLRSYPEQGLILLKGKEGIAFFNNNFKKIEISSKFNNYIYDDLGAGDVFIGHLLSSYYNKPNENNIINLLERATEAAGKACQYEGASNVYLA